MGILGFPTDLNCNLRRGALPLLGLARPMRFGAALAALHDYK
jgi:hypothetical protein